MSDNRPVIGNSGNPGSYNYPGNLHISAFGPGGGMPPQGGYYPGLEHNFMQQGMQGMQGMTNLPAVIQSQTEVLPAAASSTSKGLFGGMLNMNQIKTFVDKMGGIEGILNTMNKVQGIMSQFNQVAPMLKVLFKNFGSGGGSSGTKSAGSGSKKSRIRVKKKGKKTVPQKRRRR